MFPLMSQQKQAWLTISISSIGVVCYFMALASHERQKAVDFASVVCLQTDGTNKQICESGENGIAIVEHPGANRGGSAQSTEI